MAGVRLEGLAKGYAGRTVLPGLDLELREGECFTLLGPSGCGKTVLLRLVAGFERVDAGRIVLGDATVADAADGTHVPPNERGVGVVFQDYAVWPHMTVAANVSYPLKLAGVPAAELRERTAAVVAQVGLAGLEARYPSQLSGGQQQRVALARALINDPAILLADEPTGNLDSATSHEIMSMIRALNRERGVTVIVVTHEADIAAYADRTVTLRDGLIESDVRTSLSFPSPLAGRVRPTGASDSAELGPVRARWGEGGARAAPGEGRSEHPSNLREPLTTSLFPPKPGAERAAHTPLSVPLVSMTAGAALAALGRNKLRTALTMLGVFIGVAALIAMLAGGNGANAAVRRQMASLGTSLFVILPGASTQSGVRAGQSSASSLTVADAEAIERDVGAVARVSYIDRQVAQAQYGGSNWSTAVEGVTPAFLRILDWRTQAGRALTAADGDTAAMVCMIGQTVYRKLFAPDEDPVGATVLIKGRPLRVVGLLAARGQSSFGTDQDDVIVLPFETAERRVIGVAVPAQAPSPVTERFPPAPNPYGLQPKLAGMVNLIFVEARAPETVADAMRGATTLLARRHGIRPGEPDDFNVRNLSEIASTAEKTGRVIALLLAILATISLLVGGVGIMNILLVSVTERTREIGIRMAIGARRRHVLLQFLVEAALISLAGGAAGIAVGLAASWAIASLARWPVEVSLAAVLGSLAFSAVVGVFFGWYPAHKAAQLDPIEALRFE